MDRTLLKSELVVSAGIISLYYLFVYIMLKGFFAEPVAWAFDIKYMINNNLLPYRDLRPGYPPVGLAPYFISALVIRDEFLLNVAYLMLNFLFIILALLTLWILLKPYVTDRYRLGVLTTILFITPTAINTFFYPRGDFLSLALIIIGIKLLVDRKPVSTGTTAAFGFLAKFYSAILLVMGLFTFKGWRRKFLFTLAFLVATLLISLPFLCQDPLMYLSSFLSVIGRGPSETIFATLDGYYGHTGFLHPTYEATFYQWQFNGLHPPSHTDHFRYLWSHPFLKTLSTLLQLTVLVWGGKIAGTKEGLEQVRAIGLVLLLFFTFSTIINPVMILFLNLAILLTLIKERIPVLIATVSASEIITFFHQAIWTGTLNLTLIYGKTYLMNTVVSARLLLIMSVLLIVIWRESNEAIPSA